MGLQQSLNLEEQDSGGVCEENGLNVPFRSVITPKQGD